MIHDLTKNATKRLASAKQGSCQGADIHDSRYRQEVDQWDWPFGLSNDMLNYPAVSYPRSLDRCFHPIILHTNDLFLLSLAEGHLPLMKCYCLPQGTHLFRNRNKNRSLASISLFSWNVVQKLRDRHPMQMRLWDWLTFSQWPRETGQLLCARSIRRSYEG